MTLPKHRAAAGSAVALVLALAACGGGGGGGGGGNNPQPNAQGNASSGGGGGGGGGQRGGELKVLNQADFEHLDPARNYVTNSGNAGRLIYRTITMVKEEEGKPAEIIGDLASSWKSENGNKTWTFTLKDGLKYEDGSPITAKDLKYGIERSFSADLAEGSPYPRQYLEGGEKYKGPYVGGNNGGKGLASIKAVDDKTITFELNQPVADFMWTASMFNFSPVPQAKDTKTEYDNRPFSSGPYKVDSYTRNQSLTLVRNDQWDKATDSFRTALPDRITFQFGADPNVIDQRLFANAADDQTALSQDVTVQNQSLARTQQADVRNRVIEGPSTCVWYLALHTQKAPMDNLKVRQAVQYAVNKQDYQTARGGEAFGEVANSPIPKTLPGYRDVPLYQAPPTGDPARSKQLLQEAGVTNPKVTIAASDTGKGLAAAEAAQASLTAGGFDATLKKLPAAAYYTTIQNDAQAPEIMNAGWCPDWPSSSSVLPPILGPDSLISPDKHNTNNYSRYNNKANWAEMGRIATQVSDPAQAGEAWAALNEKIMQDAPLVPIMADAGIWVTGSKVTNKVITPSYGGEIDLVRVGVQP